MKPAPKWILRALVLGNVWLLACILYLVWKLIEASEALKVATP